MKSITLSVFIVTYILLLSLPKHRSRIAFVSALSFIVLGVVPLDRLLDVLDLNVLLMIGGMMGTVALFIESKMPQRLADQLLMRTPNVKWAILALALFSGLISAFIDNVATVLMLAPVALSITQKLKINPVPALIAISVASNLQGASTLVGDTTSILLGGYNTMDFLDFFFFQGRISIFFIIQVGALASTLVLAYLFRTETQRVDSHDLQAVEDAFPTWLLGATIALLIGASFIPNKWALTNGLICSGVFLIGLVRHFLQEPKLRRIHRVLIEIDLSTLILLASLFVLIGGLTQVGLIDDLADGFIRVAGSNRFLIYSLLVWGSVVVSAFVDNIPYVATMLPLISLLSLRLNMDPTLLYFGMLSGATLGGNITPIGASANITTLGILRKAGYSVTTRDFMRIGLPFTLSAIISAYVVLWLIWA